MHWLASLLGGVLLALVLADAFNTIVLPRRTRYGFRVTRLFYRSTYIPYKAVARRIRSGEHRESYLSVYGPLSLLALIGIWAAGVILGFGLIQWGQGIQWNGRPASLFDSVYLSATTFATISTGDPRGVVLKLLVLTEGLLGLGFLGLNISYLPALYQSFSRRELRIALLDARAGSPPSAIGLLQSEHASARRLENQMAEWELWAADLMEDHLSYPVLAYFRSHHVNQSWLTTLVTVVDAAAVLLTCAEGDLKTQAGLTFAIGRHALADIAVVFRAGQPVSPEERLSSAAFHDLCDRLSIAETPLRLERLSEPDLRRLREMYEPFAVGLSRHFLMALPPWVPDKAQSNWSIAGTSQQSPGYTVSDPFNRR